MALSSAFAKSEFAGWVTATAEGLTVPAIAHKTAHTHTHTHTHTATDGVDAAHSDTEAAAAGSRKRRRSEDAAEAGAKASEPSAVENGPQKRAVRVDVRGKPVLSRRARAALADKPKDTDERLKRTVFVGNVPLSTTHRALARWLQPLIRPGSDMNEPKSTRAKQAESAGEKDAEKGAATHASAESGAAAPAAAGTKRRSAEAEAGAPAAAGEKPEAGPYQTLDIESIRFRSVPIAAVPIASSDYRLMRKAAFIQGAFDESRDSMNAYVVCRTEAAAKAALVANGQVFMGKHVRVDACGKEPEETKFEHKRSVFLGNMSYDVSEEAVREFFAGRVSGGHDSIEGVRIVRDRTTNKGKGFGYVMFKERTHVAEALGAHGQLLAGRPVRVTRCTPDGSAADGDKPAGRKSSSGARRSGDNAARLPRHMGVLAEGKDKKVKKGSGGAKVKLPGFKVAKPAAAAQRTAGEKPSGAGGRRSSTSSATSRPFVDKKRDASGADDSGAQRKKIAAPTDAPTQTHKSSPARAGAKPGPSQRPEKSKRPSETTKSKTDALKAGPATEGTGAAAAPKQAHKHAAKATPAAGSERPASAGAKPVKKPKMAKA